MDHLNPFDLLGWVPWGLIRSWQSNRGLGKRRVQVRHRLESSLVESCSLFVHPKIQGLFDHVHILAPSKSGFSFNSFLRQNHYNYFFNIRSHTILTFSLPPFVDLTIPPERNGDRIPQVRICGAPRRAWLWPPWRPPWRPSASAACWTVPAATPRGPLGPNGSGYGGDSKIGRSTWNNQFSNNRKFRSKIHRSLIFFYDILICFKVF